MRKTAFAILVLILLVSTLSFCVAVSKPKSVEAVTSSTTELFIDPANVTNTALVPGSTFTVALNLSNVANMYGYQFQINWTSTVLNLLSVHDTIPYKGATFLAQNESNMVNGMSFIITSTGALSTAVTGNFQLRTMVFKVVGTGKTPITIDLANTVLGDATGTAIPYTAINGYFSNAAAPPPTQFKLTISVNGTGTTNPAVGTHLYNESTVVSVSATPGSGFKFDYWMLDSANSGSTNPLSVTMNKNHTLEAFFVPSVIPPTQFKLTISVNGTGTTNPAVGTHLYNESTVVSVSATPGSGFKFDYWMLDGVNSGVANPINVTMNADHMLTAVFTTSPVIPEYWLGPILGLIGCFAALGVYRFSKRNISKTLLIAH